MGSKVKSGGIRRFQNEDRTWTEEGKIRYGNGGDGRKKSTSVKEFGDVKLSEIDHNTSGDNQIGKFIARSALNIALIPLNPLNAVNTVGDVVRGAQAISASSKEKKAEKRQGQDEKDKKTGLPLKAKEATPEQDVKMVNPGFKNFNSNTKNNCVLCSTAFELRRRGYDVTASKAGRGYSFEEYGKWFKGTKFESKSEWGVASALQMPSRKKGAELEAWANDKILKQGEGARGYLSVQWGPQGGHSMAYEVRNGKVLVHDAQCGKTKSLRSVTNASVNIGYTRLDDKEPNWAAMRAAGVI